VVLMIVSPSTGMSQDPTDAGALPEPDELKRWKLDQIRRAGTHIMGRVTYQEMADTGQPPPTTTPPR
jgi:hypothetical protein